MSRRFDPHGLRARRATKKNQVMSICGFERKTDIGYCSNLHIHPMIRASNADGTIVGLSFVLGPRTIGLLWYGSSIPAKAANISFFSNPVAWSRGVGNSGKWKQSGCTEIIWLFIWRALANCHIFGKISPNEFSTRSARHDRQSALLFIDTT